MALTDEGSWLPVIGRSLALLCLTATDTREEPMLVQAKFLEGLGLPRRDVAAMLGTTVDSLGAQERKARNRRGKNGNSKKTRRA
jgi:hypothetical protein